MNDCLNLIENLTIDTLTISQMKATFLPLKVKISPLSL